MARRKTQANGQGLEHQPELKPGQLVIYTDGACKGNPGPMAMGISIQGEGVTVSISGLLGHGTSNIAEYKAAIVGLKKAQMMKAEEVDLRMDSELVVKQLSGEYSVKHEALKPLHAEALELLKLFPKYKVKHVPREQNTRADELANQAYSSDVASSSGG